jgi:uncharacterized membrane protein
MVDSEKAAGQQEQRVAGERPSSGVVMDGLATAESDDDVALVHREMEFAAAERLMFFSDAVVAIALTLLALDLPVPGGTENVASISISDMLADAGRHLDDYLAFLISFLVIGAHWRLHHRMFRYVRVPTTAIVRLNMYWLLLIVITPFTTRMLSVGQQNLLRFGFYAATEAIQFAIFAVIIVLILRGQPIPAHLDMQRLRGGLWQSIAMALGFAISIPLYLVIGQVAFAVWAAVPITANLIKPFLRGRLAKVA